ncbi:hypothetical protein II906_03365 [bacterium]|nr:hypothetical protein [bacterium]
MKKIDYVEEIKKSAKDIDFDDATKRLFEDYVDFEKTSANMVFRTLLKLVFAFLNRYDWLCV